MIVGLCMWPVNRLRNCPGCYPTLTHMNAVIGCPLILPSEKVSSPSQLLPVLVVNMVTLVLSTQPFAVLFYSSAPLQPPNVSSDRRRKSEFRVFPSVLLFESEVFNCIISV